MGLAIHNLLNRNLGSYLCLCLCFGCISLRRRTHNHLFIRFLGTWFIVSINRKCGINRLRDNLNFQRDLFYIVHLLNITFILPTCIFFQYARCKLRCFFRGLISSLYFFALVLLFLGILSYTRSLFYLNT